MALVSGATWGSFAAGDAGTVLTSGNHRDLWCLGLSGIGIGGTLAATKRAGPSNRPLSLSPPGKVTSRLPTMWVASFVSMVTLPDVERTLSPICWHVALLFVQKPT
jgi:hypothetical protein